MTQWEIAVIGLCILSGPGVAGLITNGSFEVGDEPGAWRSLYAPDSVTIRNWTVSAGSVDYIGSYWQAADGNRSLDLTGTGAPGTIVQTFVTPWPGVPHRISFALAGNPDVQPRTTGVRVWINDPNVLYRDFTFVVNGQTRSNMGWTYVSWWFTPSSAVNTLGFTSLDNYPGLLWGPALDDVRVDAVPEPGTLLLVGLALIVASSRRR